MLDQRRILAMEILNHLNDGTIKVNSDGKLPSERELASFLGVSRPILRQAIAVLEAFGFLEIRERQGIFRASREISDMTFPGDWPPSTILEIFQVRLLLEPNVARLVAKSHTSEDLRIIRESITQMAFIVSSQAQDRETLMAKWNHIFHARIISAAKNQFLNRIYETISQAYEKASTSIPFRREELPFDIIFEEHQRIVNAIEQRDGDMAAYLVTKHLQASVERAVNNLRKSGFGVDAKIIDTLFSHFFTIQPTEGSKNITP